MLRLILEYFIGEDVSYENGIVSINAEDGKGRIGFWIFVSKHLHYVNV